MKNRNQSKGEKFTKCILQTMQTDAWRALSPTAQAAYVWVKLEWKGPQANNNGKIAISVRQLAERMGVTANTASKALHDLQAKGFIVVTKQSCVGVTGMMKSPNFEITELATSTSENQNGKKLYLEWELGHDFTVVKAQSNNPTGKSGKTKPHLKNYDKPVLKIATFSPRLSQK